MIVQSRLLNGLGEGQKKIIIMKIIFEFDKKVKKL